ncbi:MAG: metallophosphoesterase family protein [Thiohalospira sp.]
MKKIGLLSDTHGFIDDKMIEFFSSCDEIWHAGDIGNLAVADKLSQIKPLKAVYGNIDGQEVRAVYPKIQKFQCEQVNVFMIHIGGYPGKYEKEAKTIIQNTHVDMFISGHSHILKVMYDQENELLHVNPGAAGKSGLHKHQTAVRFIIDGKNIKDLEVFEMKR